MAVSKKSFELDPVEIQWVKLSLSTQIGVLRRKFNSETPGSEIHNLRAKEIAAVSSLQDKF